MAVGVMGPTPGIDDSTLETGSERPISASFLNSVNLLVELTNRVDQTGQSKPSIFWQRGRNTIYHRHYGLDALSTLTEYDSEFGEMSADRTYCHGPLPYQQTSSPM